MIVCTLKRSFKHHNVLLILSYVYVLFIDTATPSAVKCIKMTSAYPSTSVDLLQDIPLQDAEHLGDQNGGGSPVGEQRDTLLYAFKPK